MPEAVERGVAAGDKRPTTSHAGRVIAGGVLSLAVMAGAAYAQDIGPPAGGGGIGGAAGPAAPTTGGAPAAGGGGIGGIGLPAARPPSLLISPSLGVNEQFTDNALETPTQRQADLITTISPALAISDQSARLQGEFNYNPQALEHLAISGEDQIIQNLYGSGTFTAVPNLLFFDAQASASEASRVGGRGFGNQSQIPTSSATQTYLYSASPYMDLHFGDTGDNELRYRFSETVFSGNNGAIASTIPGQGIGAISNSIENEISDRFTTGAAFGKLQLSVNLDYQDNNSAGSISSKSETASVNSSYQLINSLALLVTAGYDNLSYPGESSNFGGAYDGADYSAGFRYQPRDDRSIQLTYGKSQGQNTFAGNALYSLSPFTTISASYTTTTTTTQQQLLQNLSQATQTVPGTTINQATGLPQSIVNPNLALQNGVYRDQNLTAGITTASGQRNTYSLLFNHSVNSALSAGAFSQTSDGATAAWNRDISPYLQGTMNAGYSTTNSTSAGAPNTSSDSVTFGASLNYAVSPTLTASASYLFTLQNGVSGTLTGATIGSTSGSVLIDLVTVSLRKTF